MTTPRTALTVPSAAESAAALLGSRASTFRGFHNASYLSAAAPDGGRDVLRERRDVPVLVPRIWPDEAEVLRCLERAGMPLAPRVLEAGPGGTFLRLTYLPGLSPAPEAEVREKIGSCFAAIVAVPREQMPALPEDWPEDGDSTGFLRALAGFAERELDQERRRELGTLLKDLGVPEQVMARYRARLPELTPRPFALLHTDLHRGNLVLGPDGILRVIDWEHAMIGDPVHELAVHLRRSGYPRSRRASVVATWRAAVSSVNRRFDTGVERDVEHYLQFERAQSVFPDVLRAARSLGAELEAPTLRRAVERIGRAVVTAVEPLRLTRVPDAVEIERVLRRWHHETRSAVRVS